MDPTTALYQIPEAIRVAIELGLVCLVLVFTAQFPRLRVVWPLLVVLALGEALRLGVIDRRWALSSLLRDAPWRFGALILLSQLLGLAWLRFAPARFGWLAAAWLSPSVAGHPGLQGWWGARLPEGAARAVRVGTALAVAQLLPWFFPAGLVMGRIGRLELRGLGLGLVVVMGVVWMLGARGRAAGTGAGSGAGTDAAPAPGPRWAALGVQALLHALLAVLLGWLFILSGAPDLVGTGIEGVESWLPGIPWAGLAFCGAAAGLAGDRLLVAMTAGLVFERALSVHGNLPPEALMAGITAGGLVPLAWALRTERLPALGLGALQVALVVTWFWWR